ncbi:hypothetical protein ACP4OV_003697 [Aristida adscensionis]
MAGSEAKAAMANGQRSDDEDDDDDDELFDLDLSLIDCHDNDDEPCCFRHHFRRPAAVPVAVAVAVVVAGGEQQALMANCLLPVSSVSGAVPVTASSIVVSSSPYTCSAYQSSASRRLFFTGGGRRRRRRRRFLGRPAASSMRLFGFSTKGFRFQASGCLQRMKNWSIEPLTLDQEDWKGFIYHNLNKDSAPPGSSFSLCIEVDSSHREAKVIFFCKSAGVEMITEGWYNYSLPAVLLEEHKNEPVDTNIGLWALIRDDLSPCNLKGAWLSTEKNKWNME